MRHLSCCLLILFALPLSAADDRDALEAFAWAEDRAKAVERFLPGSDQHWYHRCLLAQHQGDLAEVDRLIAAWSAARTGDPPETLTRMRLRQAALKVDTTGTAGLKALAEQMGMVFDHPAPAGADGAPDGAGRVDAASWTWEEMRKHAREDAKAFEQLTVIGLARILPELQDPAQRRRALDLITDPTVPGLEEAVIADLATERTRAFGASPIHAHLTDDQLDRIAAAVPRLAGDAAYVAQRLRRLVARHDEVWKRQAAARQAYLQALAAFMPASGAAGAVRELGLALLLADARAEGRWDRVLFDRWMGEHLARRPDRPRLEDDAALRLTSLEAPPERLRDDQLDHWLALAPDPAWAVPLLGEADARPRFIAAKVLAGVGDVADWYRQLDNAQTVEALQRRRELLLAPGQRTRWQPGETPALRCTLKRIDALTVRIWRLDEEAVLRPGRNLEYIPDCAGLQPTVVRSERFEKPEHLRHETVLALAECAAPGAYAVDITGADQGLRALIRVGGLHALTAPTADGLEVAVVDDDGRPVPDATVHVGGQRYAVDRAGLVLLPFSSKGAQTPAVIAGNGRAVRATLTPPMEEYQLHGHMFATHDQFLAGTTATLVLRCVLSCHDEVLPLARLLDPVAIVTWKDDAGSTVAVDTLPATLRDDQDAVLSLRTPERAAQIDVEVRGRVHNRTAIADQELTSRQHLILADRQAEGAPRTDRIASWLLQCEGGRFRLLARGRAGEPVPQRTVTLTAHHELGGTDPLTARSDGAGVIDCGPLTGVSRLTVTEGEERPWHWELPLQPGADRPVVIATTQRWICTAPARPVVLRHDEGLDLAVMADACTGRDGFWEVGPLPAGRYRVIAQAREHELLVTDGQVVGHHLAGPGQAVAVPPLRPACRAQVEGDTLVIRVRQASPGLRVHCLATQVWPDETRRRDDAYRHRPPASTTWDPVDSRFAQRTVGSEERYTLDRHGLPRWPGMMLDRPSPLLDPVSPASATTAVSRSMASLDRELSCREGSAKSRALSLGVGSKGSESATAMPHLAFLATPPPVVANLVPDAGGVVRVPLARFGGAHLVEVVACDGLATIQDRVVLPPRPLPLRERRLTAPFDAGKPLSVRMDLVALAAGGILDLPNHPITGLRLVDSVASLLDLFAATHADEALAAWHDLGRWHQLDAAARGRLYDRLASHELHLFLARRDPAWCKQHLAPYLAGKLQPTLVDRWITGGDLSPYVQADRFTSLNAVERVLLAWGLPAAADQERRLLREQVGRQTEDAQGFTHFIEAALATVPPGPRGTLMAIIPPADHETVGDATAPAAGATFGQELGKVLGTEPELVKKEEKAEAVAAPAAAAAPDVVAKPAPPTRRFYRMPGEPQVLKEASWYQRKEEEAPAWTIRPSPLWAALAAHDPAKPFLPVRGLDALENHHALLAALAFIDLPFEAQPPRWSDIPDGRRLTVAGPTLAVLRTLTTLPTRDGTISLRQRLVESDAFEKDGTRAPVITRDCRPRTAYTQELVLGNLTPGPLLVQALIQIPAGAVPLDGAATRCEALNLEPFDQAALTIRFYWPEAGERRQCAVTVNDTTHRLATLPALTWTVRDDAAGGPWTALTDRAAFLQHLRHEDLEFQNLGQATWMLTDAAFYREAIAILRERRHFEQSWWAFALHHGDLQGAAELLRAVPELGPAFHSRWLTCDVLDSGELQLLDVVPLVNQRVHRHPDSGDGTVRTYYDQLCQRLAHRATLDDRDRYTLVCALLLQERIPEAAGQFARIDVKATDGRLPWDHARAWLALAKGEVDAARTITARHRAHPVGHWRERFAELDAQLDEIAGRDAARGGDVAERRVLERQAAAEPSLRLERRDAGNLAIAARNLRACTLRWRGVDLETLFSRTPFGLATDTGDLSLVTPTLEQPVVLEGDAAAVAIPAAWRGRTAVVEAVGAGARATLLVVDDDLDVTVSAGSGLVRVHTRDGRPVAAAYVKVYRRHQGEAVFHKDGYTDRRGLFDHAAVNGTALPAMDRLALYIEAEGHGAVVREVDPPQE